MQTSVIICTHNPRPEYLRRTLDALRRQTLALSGWELLLVDNASREKLSDTWDLSWHPNSRHVREDELGLTPARLRGIKEARGNTLVFVDDDNLLAPNFLEQVQGVIACNPHLGVFGAGSLEAEFEAPPAPELVPFLGLLALRSVSSTLWSNNPADIALIPWGAGMSVTRNTADSYLQLIQELNVKAVLGRRGRQLFAAEDDLFSWASLMTGKGFGIFPNLYVTHLISAGRLNHSYFIQMIHDHRFSHEVLKHLLVGTASPDTRFLSRIVQGLRLVLHGMRNGQFSMRCHWATIRGRQDAARFISDQRLSTIKNATLKPWQNQRKHGLDEWSQHNSTKCTP